MINRKLRIGLLFVLFGWISSGCSTMDQSLELGGTMGMLVGAGATAGGYAAGGHGQSLEAIGIGAGIGTVIGLATSYFTHKAVESDRAACQADQIEMHFGDLPPSPFVVPNPQSKKGSH